MCEALTRYATLVLFFAAALAACSKSKDAREERGAQPAAAEVTDQAGAAEQSRSSAEDVKGAAFTSAIKADFASQFVSSASEACASTKGKEFPDPKSGAAMQYTASGVISWGRGSLNYVKEPGAIVVLTSDRVEKTFAFGADIYELPKGDRKYVAGLSQLKGGPLGATVTDETKAVDGDAILTTGNICVGNTVPALVSQGMWPLAAKHLQVPPTTMLCSPLGKLESQSISFAFDGTTIRAGANSFVQTDSVSGEVLSISPNSGNARVTYSVSKADGNGVSLGLSHAKVLVYAAIDQPGGVHLFCGPK